MIILKVQVDVKVFNFLFLGMILKIPTPSQSRMIAFLETNNKIFDKRYGIIVCTLGLTISPRARPPHIQPFQGTTWRTMHILFEKKAVLFCYRQWKCSYL